MLVDSAEQHEVEQFLYDEAALLDAGKYSRWLELFTEDTHYWMPVRQTRATRDTADEFTSVGEIAFFDENKTTLGIRVRKIEHPLAWGDSPRARSRHMVFNIRVIAIEGHELTVECAFHLYRASYESDVDQFVGRRQDVLRRVDGGFRIAKRSIFLDHTVITQKNMYQFF